MGNLICSIIGHKLNANSFENIDKTIITPSGHELDITRKICCERCKSVFLMNDFTIYNTVFYDMEGRSKMTDLFKKDKNGRFILSRKAMSMAPNDVAVVVETTKENKVKVYNNNTMLGNMKFNHFISRIEYVMKRYNEELSNDELIKMLTSDDSETGKLTVMEKSND